MQITIEIDDVLYKVTMPSCGADGVVSVHAGGRLVATGRILRTGRWRYFDSTDNGLFAGMQSKIERRLMAAIKSEHQKQEDGDANRGNDGNVGADSADRS